MPHVRSRDDDSGRPRYTAYYRDIHGKQKSAGTFDTLKQARDAGTEAQARVLDGRFLDTASGKLTFERYTTTIWLPNLTFEATTRQGYAFVVHKYLLDFFGPIRMNQIMPGAIREYYALLLDAGVGVSTVHKAKTVLCSIFNTAVNDRVIALHPCHGVPAPHEPVRRRTILSPAQYQRIRHHLPETWRLLTDLALDSACRWGELAELRVKDLDARYCELHVDRTVVELDKTHRPDGHDRFLIKDYTKNGEQRTVALSPDLVRRLTAHIHARDAQPDDLLFPATPTSGTGNGTTAEPCVPATFTRGARRFTHGTLYAYTVGQCRCETCQAEMAAYRADRRSHGCDRPTTRRATASEQHLSNDWFRRRIWQPTVRKAGITAPVTVHDLRHAAATWSLHGGANLQQVRTMLGHKSLRAVERYLHEMPGTTNRNALDANHRARTQWDQPTG
jgi:integrase